MQRNLSKIALVLFVASAICTLSSTTYADWDENNPADFARAKWIQRPDLTTTGMDVLDTQQPVFTIPPGPLWKTLADDFKCTQSGPITDAHIWGSWLNDVLPTTSAGNPNAGLIEFKISFWSDLPVGANNSFSQPDQLLWTGLFQPGQFQVNPNVIPANEQFYDPNLNLVIGSDTQVYQYNFSNLVDANGLNFIQSVGTIYWLEVQANVLNTPGTVPATFGWKTSQIQDQFNDDAVFADTAGFLGPNLSGWQDMHYPSGHPFAGHSLDLSFVLTVPEPSSIAMASLGLVALVGMGYRRHRKTAC